MDVTLLAGLWHRFRRDRDNADWEESVAREVEALTASGEQHVKLMIPALQSELGRRLEVATQLMRDKGYRLHMVTPDGDLTWAAGYERITEGTE